MAKKKVEIDELKNELKGLDLPENTLQRLVDNEYEFTNEDMVDTDINNTQDVADSSEEIEEKVEVNYKGRGFKTYEECVNFVNTEKFKRLGVADQEEFIAWLNK
jgi:hypothetical protein